VLATLSSAANLVDACVHWLFNNFPPPARAMSHVEPLNWERHTVSFGGVEARGEGGHHEMMLQ
jgi:hypothetical protein